MKEKETLAQTHTICLKIHQWNKFDWKIADHVLYFRMHKRRNVTQSSVEGYSNPSLYVSGQWPLGKWVWPLEFGRLGDRIWSSDGCVYLFIDIGKRLENFDC